MKECKNCKKNLGIEFFNKLRRNKDGYNTICKLCVSKKRRTHNKIIICKKCKVNFNGNRRKLCENCYKEPRKRSYKECLLALEKCNSRLCFQKNFPNLYSYARKNNILNKLYNEVKLPSKRVCHTYEKCLEKAKICKSINEFNTKYKKYYSAAHRNGWLDSIYKEINLYKNCGGYTLSRFKELCKLNNNNKGIFYIIKCFSEIENFYKIGITSQNINLRYKDQYRMPYDYKVVLLIKEDPEIVWKIEKNIKKQIKNKLYEPLKKFNGSKTECFIL